MRGAVGYDVGLLGRAMTSGESNWAVEKHYVERQLDDLKDSVGVITAELSEIRTELRAYKRAAQFLVALGSMIGIVLGWFAKAMGKA